MVKLFQLVCLGMSAILGINQGGKRPNQIWRNEIIERAKTRSDAEQLAQDWANIQGDMAKAYQKCKAHYGV